MTEKYPPALRISQLDALELDRSLVELLTSQLQLCLKHKVLGKNVSSVEPHLRALLCGALLYKTLWKSGVTVGQKLLSLRYASGDDFGPLPPKKCAAIVLSLFFTQCWNFFSGYLSKLRGFNSVEGVLTKYHALISLVNWLVFLRQGHYPTLTERLLGVRTVFSEQTFERSITFDFMEREILWHGYANSAMYLASLVNFNKMWCKVRKFISQSKSLASGQDDTPDRSMCAFCEHTPCSPCIAACERHTFCYYCAAVALALDERATCPACDMEMSVVRSLPCSVQLRTIA